MAVKFVQRTFPSISFANDQFDGVALTADADFIFFANIRGNNSAPNRMLKRNAATKNYDVEQTIAGSGNIDKYNVAFSRDKSKVLLTGGAGVNGTIYRASRLAEGASPQYGNVAINSGGGGSPRVTAMDISHDGNYVATMRTDNILRIQPYGSDTVTYSIQFPTTGDDCKFSPSGEWLAVLARDGIVRFFRRSGNTWAFVDAGASMPNMGDWQIRWHPNGDHFVTGSYTIANRGVTIGKKTGDATFAKLANPFSDGGPAWNAIAACYIAAGKYLVIFGYAANQMAVYRREGDSYIRETDVQGLPTSFAAYMSDVSNDGKVMCITPATTGGTPLVIEVEAGQQVTAALSFDGLTAAVSAKQVNRVRSAPIVLPGLTAAATAAMPNGVFLDMVLGQLSGEGTVAVGDDIVPAIPDWNLGEPFVQSDGGDVLFAERAPQSAYLYGDLRFGQLTAEALMLFPIEGMGDFVLPGLTAAGRVKFPLELESEITFPELSAKGELDLIEMGVIGDWTFGALATAGEIHVPFAGESYLTLGALSAAGEINVPFGAIGDWTLGALSAAGEVDLTYQVEIDAVFPMLEFDGRGPDPLFGAGTIGLSALDFAGEVYVPLGVIGDARLPALTSEGTVYQTLAVDETDMVLPLFTTDGYLDRFNSVDANFRLFGLTVEAFGGPANLVEGALTLFGLQMAATAKQPIEATVTLTFGELALTGTLRAMAGMATGNGTELTQGSSGLFLGGGPRLMTGDDQFRMG